MRPHRRRVSSTGSDRRARRRADDPGGETRTPIRIAAVILAALAALPAFAGTYVVRSQSEGEAYALRAWRNAWNDALLLPRQRLYDDLSLYGNDVVAGHDVDLAFSLRVGTDLGWRAGEPEALDGVNRDTAELLVGNIRWRALNRHLGITVGRMLRLGLFDFRYVDGADVGYALGPIRAEAFGGLMVKAGSFLGSPTFEPDGVRSSAAALAKRVGSNWPYPIASYQSAPAFIWGAEVGTTPMAGIVATLGYQRAMSAGHVDLERAAGSVAWRRFGVEVTGNAEYDLFMSRLDYLQAKVDTELPGRIVAGVLYLRAVPTFDANSIWNSFAVGPLEEADLFGRWHPRPSLSFEVRARARRYTDVVYKTSSLSVGGSVDATWRPGPGHVYAFHASYLGGYGGTQAWVQGDARRTVYGALSASLGLAGGYADDPLLPNQATATFGGRAGLHYAFDRQAVAHLYVEDDTSKLIANDFRVYVVLDLGVGF